MSNLAEYYNELTHSLGIQEGQIGFNESLANTFDGNADLAVDLISSANIEYGTPDIRGNEINGEVQILLQLAFTLSPALASHVSYLLGDGGA